ncbi:hypothetical protein [Gudongella sp. DL1XJH-153]|uniref:hypothetical protein n=1 Tax=Gudongella sp. DL1XJH-153 TaxID=3409804 RepID=UPI003BB6C835
MLNLLQAGSSNKKGYTIIEIVMAIGFLGISIVIYFSIMRSTEESANRIQKFDDFMLNGRYATEYVIEDVMLADEIISMEEYYPGGIQQSDTLGFILINHNNGVNTDTKDYDNYFKYKYIYYRLTGDVVFRSTYSHNSYRPENAPSNGGDNVLAKNVISIGDSNYCPEDRMLFIDIETQDPASSKKYKFMETKYLGKY